MGLNLGYILKSFLLYSFESSDSSVNSLNLKHMVTTSDLHQWILGPLVHVWWILDQHQTRVSGGGFRVTDVWNWRISGTFSGIFLLINCHMDYFSFQKLLHQEIKRFKKQSLFKNNTFCSNAFCLVFWHRWQHTCILIDIVASNISIWSSVNKWIDT